VNLLAIPFFNLVLVPLSVLATLALSFDALTGPAAPFVQASAALAGGTARVLHAVAELPAASASLPLPPWPTLVVAAAGVSLAVCGAALPGRRFAWLALLPIGMPTVRLPPHGVAHVVVLDVGHGLAVLVETRNSRLLFDAGPTARSGFDSGAEIVVPALGANGRRGLDRLIVSHADNDHAGGAAAVVAAFPRVAVIKGPDVVELAGEVCAHGQRWEADGVRFSILHPQADFSARGNESSCVLKVETGASSMLVTGDIERRGERAVATQPIDADVVVVPHHGSATSSSAEFVAAVGAKHAIVSAGYANRWGFPRAEVRERWEKSGATMTVTGDSGAVSVLLAPDHIAVTGERDGRHRYWHAPRFPW
jgi:competence protein ComEC